MQVFSTDSGLQFTFPLALTNRGAATTSDLLALARAIRDGVTLENEPVFVGVSL